MKRLTESQIRQVIGEELVGLLNEIQAYERYPEMAPEQLRNHGEYLGSITVDEHIYRIALEKDKLVKQFYSVMKKAAIDAKLFANAQKFIKL